jgi:putative chitinase
MIESPSRIAGFLAQTSHESGKYKFLTENLNYSDKGLLKTFPKYFNESNVMEYARKPEAIANRVYANRMGNGDEVSGDGWRYCGRGLIQLTGKNNYQAFANSEQMNIEEVPDYLITYVGAVRSALWFWNKNNLNETADAGDLLMMTKKINGGTHGLAERTAEYKRILEIYSA